jgi:4-hydroxybenzoate polyprenyltransferase
LDAYSNVLYAVPGFLALWQFSGAFPAWWVFVSALSWNAAMHAFSAAPDIQADKKAGLQTVATVLGLRGVLVFCSLHWLIPGLLSAWFWHPAAVVFGLYAVIPALVLLHPSIFDLEKVYWLMPWVNMLVGFGLFWLMIWA